MNAVRIHYPNFYIFFLLAIQLNAFPLLPLSSFLNSPHHIKWFSTFLKLRPINTTPQTVLTPNRNIILMLLQNCNLAAVMNSNVTIWHRIPNGVTPWMLRTTGLHWQLSLTIFSANVSFTLITSHFLLGKNIFNNYKSEIYFHLLYFKNNVCVH